MNIPGFNAERSLYSTSARYQQSVQSVGAEAGVFPQLKQIVGTGPGRLRGICQQVGDLVNDAVNEANDPSNDASEQQAWRDLANEMISRGRSNIGCTFAAI
jgi:hypothetical protein